MFGEIELVLARTLAAPGSKIPRLFHAHVLKDTRLVTVPKSAFLGIPGWPDLESICQRLLFIRNLPLFQPWRKSAGDHPFVSQYDILTIARLHLGSMMKKIGHGEFLARGNPLPDLLAVYSGAVDLVWELPMTAPGLKIPVVRLEQGTTFGFQHEAHHPNHGISPAHSLGVVSCGTTKALVLSRSLIKKVCSRQSIRQLRTEVEMRTKWLETRIDTLTANMKGQKVKLMLNLRGAHTGRTTEIPEDMPHGGGIAQVRGYVAVDRQETVSPPPSPPPPAPPTPPRPSLFSQVAASRRKCSSSRPMSAHGRRSESRFGRWLAQTAATQSNLDLTDPLVKRFIRSRESPSHQDDSGPKYSPSISVARASTLSRVSGTPLKTASRRSNALDLMHLCATPAMTGMHLKKKKEPVRPSTAKGEMLRRTDSPVTIRRSRIVLNRGSGDTGIKMLSSIPITQVKKKRGVTPRLVRGRLFENSFRAQAQKLQRRRLQAQADFERLLKGAKISSSLGTKLPGSTTV